MGLMNKTARAYRLHPLRSAVYDGEVRTLVIVCIAAFFVGCTVLTDLDGFTGGAGAELDGAAPDATPDGAAQEAGGLDATLDGAVDSGLYSFSDDFNRADSPTLDNGWLAKNPAFKIAAGAAVRARQSSLDYTDLIVSRPPSESVRDVQVSVELKFSSTTSTSYPQLHARVQTANLGGSGVLDDYLLFPENGGKSSMTLARNHSTLVFSTLSTFPLASPLDATHTFRLLLRVTGVSPVVLFGSVERYDAPNWTTLGSASVQDTDAASALVKPGVVGLSAGSPDATGLYAYDNFVAQGL
jgi:hypothetical protein